LWRRFGWRWHLVVCAAAIDGGQHQRAGNKKPHGAQLGNIGRDPLRLV
jgi:hypothetical protein